MGPVVRMKEASKAEVRLMPRKTRMRLTGMPTKVRRMISLSCSREG